VIKMTKKNQVYKCEICGNITEVLHEGDGTLICCGKAMKLFNENSVDANLEKHIPIIEKTDNGVLVEVGSVKHPMEGKHYIEFIEIISNGIVYRKDLNPGDKPEAEFCIEGDVVARAYCNLHGLWKGG